MPSLISLKLVTAVDLKYQVSTNGKIVYHFIYASQLYGTFFAIYAKFTGLASSDGTAYTINRLTLQLINYKGTINIGFTDDIIDWNPQKRVIAFHVKGACTLTEKTRDFMPPDGPIIVRKDEQYSILFSRILDPLDGYKSFADERNGSTAAGQLSGEPPNFECFDSEFNDRDGLDFYNRDLKPGMYGRSTPQEEPEIPGQKVAGHRCNTSRVNLYF